MNKDLTLKFRKIKLLALDFDGVMTDGFVYVDEDGKESVCCSRKDGFGIGMLKEAGIKVCVISKEKNSVVAQRCEKLDISYYQNVGDGKGKLDVLKKVAVNKKIVFEEIAFMGDDINDSMVLKYAGVAVTVADGHPAVKKNADYITINNGGHHAVREVCEVILKAKNISFLK
ncbi:MAG: Low specificity phosphatase (HAD superfamily)-like protein [Parcubacteria group bacterium Athens0714_26]|nr:MAG: Low specificity phosphatase (HAD superfamily)-like protein [Parcubacteria group bacterium Athens1014_26]TSD03027.1 MAG: Low specificity phosphatase (HAD superfamily)-like protein [Parcubacteria group bacterium Athens0714_26]